jgi:hypothetical protein
MYASVLQREKGLKGGRRKAKGKGTNNERKKIT